MIRAMDRFYARHPRIAFGIAIVAAFACMYIASDWDKAETTTIRMQMMASNS
jgi:hypothetical protein